MKTDILHLCKSAISNLRWWIWTSALGLSTYATIRPFSTISSNTHCSGLEGNPTEEDVCVPNRPDVDQVKIASNKFAIFIWIFLFSLQHTGAPAHWYWHMCSTRTLPQHNNIIFNRAWQPIRCTSHLKNHRHSPISVTSKYCSWERTEQSFAVFSCCLFLQQLLCLNGRAICLGIGLWDYCKLAAGVTWSNRDSKLDNDKHIIQQLSLHCM